MFRESKVQVYVTSPILRRGPIRIRRRGRRGDWKEPPTREDSRVRRREVEGGLDGSSLGVEEDQSGMCEVEPSRLVARARRILDLR